MNSRALPDLYDITDWLLRKDTPPADVYVVSLQEVVDLNVMNVVINSSSSDEMSELWCNRIETLLNSTGIDYQVVIEKHMIGLVCMVFSRASLFNSLSDLRFSTVYTGSYGVTGNKGGIAVRFDVLDSPLCFICSHFHAHRDAVQTRNQDFQVIVDSVVFTPNTSGKKVIQSSQSSKGSESRPLSYTSKEKFKNTNLSILQHEHIFWLGDLNYRIASELDDMEVFEIVKSGNWASLRSKDQLNIERDQGNVFQNFDEGTLKFPPTYKYQPGTDVYEQRPDKKLRAPAWCDRILWRTTNKDLVKLQVYDAVRLNLSDHKPVFAWFDCSVRKVVPAKAKDVYQDLLFAVDKWINASTPKINVEGRMIDFGQVTINVSYHYLIDKPFPYRHYRLIAGAPHCNYYHDKYRNSYGRMDVRTKE